MIINHIKVAWRQIKQSRLQSIILIGGLALGMSATILLLQYVNFELSFDKFHSQGDQIYRVINERFQEGRSVQKGAITYPSIGPTMTDEFPEILQYTRLAYSSDMMVTSGDKVEAAEPALWGDESFFTFFDFPLLAHDGDPLLDRPNELVLTQDFADRFFPDLQGAYEKLIGTSLVLDRYSDPFEIVAVCASLPANSSIRFEIMPSYASCIKYWGEGADNSWQWSDFYHYLLLQPGADMAALEAKFDDFSERHFDGTAVSGSKEVFTLQPLHAAHLQSSDLEYEITRTSSGRSVWSLLLIAFFILVIAWINYTNLSSVKAIERAREVGVRKVVGASKSQLVWQFLVEALIVNFAGLVIALALVQLVSPWFSARFELSENALSFFSGGSTNAFLLLSLSILLLAGVVLSALYPSWLLSKTRVAEVLKGSVQKDPGGAYVRKGLVIFQFAMSVGLIIGTTLVAMQVRYMNKQDLGIDIDQIMLINSPELTSWDSSFIPKINALKHELTQLPGIEKATTSNRAPGERMGRSFQITRVGAPDHQTYTSNFLYVDYDYADTYDLPVVAGRFFRETDHSADFDLVDKIVITESAASMLGFENPADVLNERLEIAERPWQIVGVVQDFHQRSLHHAIEPIIFVPSYSTSSMISVKVFSSDLDRTLAQVEKKYHQFLPGNTFDFRFLDEDFDRLYQAERRFGQILTFFTFLTILIACLGLFGLASYTTHLRTREIGIRKVLGASTLGIVSLVSGSFLKLVALSVLAAFPIAYYLSREWLRDFAYAMDIPWWVFIAAGLTAILIALLTVSYQSIKVALINPAESLRQE